MVMLPSQILDAAAAKIEPEGAWTQGVIARGRSGRKVELAANATCFCVLGAIRAVARPSEHLSAWFSRDPADGAVSYLKQEIKDYVADWNDRPGRTQVEAVTALRKAADLARERGE